MLKVCGILVLLLALPLDGQTSLQFTRGWGGKDRAGRWNPVLVRASDPTPRNATLQLISPQSGGFALVLEERIAIGPTPATYELLAPTYNSPWERTVAVLRDADTGKLLAQFPPTFRKSSPDVTAVGPQVIFVGVSGARAAFDQTALSLGNAFAYLPPHQLPRSPLGYDSLEILLLNRPNLRDIDPDQQRAILDWVRAGGSLLLAPGDDPPPPDAPLVAALPCRIGDAKSITLSPDVLKDAHLPPRFAHIGGRALEPAGGARPFQLLKDPAATGYLRRYGLGQILVIPLDIAALQFEEADQQRAIVNLWQPILNALAPFPKPDPKAKYTAPYHGFQSESPEQFREGAANAAVCDFLVPPGAPPRRWPQVVLVLLALSLVLGPVDFFALKIAGQSPWTWTTALGWVASVALAAIYATTLGAPNSVKFGSARLIDQIDDATVATTDLLGLDTSADLRLNLQPLPADQPAGWWDPAIPGSIDIKTPGVQPDLPFHQNDAACIPEPFWTSPRHPRFVRQQHAEPTPPAIQAHLALTGQGPAARITGIIRNLSQTPLKSIRIRTNAGVVPLGPDPAAALPPGQQMSINLPAPGEPFAPLQSRYQNYGFYGARADTTPVREDDLWALVPDLAARRSLRIDALFESNAPVACIYAQCVDPAPIARIEAASPTPDARQYQWIRALIPLAR